MKTQEELNELKEEVETLNKKLAELTDEEMEVLSGGASLPCGQSQIMMFRRKCAHSALGKCIRPDVYCGLR